MDRLVKVSAEMRRLALLGALAFDGVAPGETSLLIEAENVRENEK